MNLNQKMLEKLLNDPKLLKEIEKLAKAAPSIKKEKKLKEAGNPTHVNKVTQICRLCKTSQIVYVRMDWDSDDKIWRSGCHASENLWPTLQVFEQTQGRPSCIFCASSLMSLSKEELIQKLIRQSERI